MFLRTLKYQGTNQKYRNLIVSDGKYKGLKKLNSERLTELELTVLYFPLGTFRFEYEYEIEYENDFSILVCRLHIITTQTHLIP